MYTPNLIKLEPPNQSSLKRATTPEHILPIVTLKPRKALHRISMDCLFCLEYELDYGDICCSRAFFVLLNPGTDIFQGRKAGVIIGFVWFSFAVGGSIGPWQGGWIFELTNNYRSAFIVAMILFGVGCAAIWWAAPRKVRQAGTRSH